MSNEKKLVVASPNKNGLSGELVKTDEEKSFWAQQVSGVLPTDAVQPTRIISSAPRNFYLATVRSFEPDPKLKIKIGSDKEQLEKFTNYRPVQTLALDEANDETSANVETKFEKVTVSLKMSRGKRVGLGIKMVHARIIVCKVEEHSLVSGVLKVGDQIEHVDQIPVADNSQCRKILISALNKKGKVEIVLTRPKTSDALAAVMEELASASQTKVVRSPSVDN